jgi:hypothetical protein
MFAENKDLFLQFKLIHDDYVKDRQKHKADFDKTGKKILTIIEEWESRLCGHMEKGNNSVFSAKLSDKFWEEIKKYYPFIDFVGVKVRKK